MRLVVLFALGLSLSACTHGLTPDGGALDAGGLDAGGLDAGSLDGGDVPAADGGAGLDDGGAPPDDGGEMNDGGALDGGSFDGPLELRGLWITRFAYSDEATLTGILERAAAAGFNAVFVQIRGNGDAYYASQIEPWAAGLSGGFLGRDPGWDPLAVAVETGHALGLEVHAYFNVFSAWPVSLAPVPEAEGDRQHPLYLHPEWLAVDESGESADTEYLWLTPGNPAVRDHTVAVARDLLSRYDVDGLHLDRIRTAGPQYSHDAVTEARFAEAQAQDPSLTFGDFMRQEVNAMVAALYQAVLDERPTAKLSAAVWGIHTRLEGCSTSQGNADYYQDSWAWAEGGYIDALVPMSYWPLNEGACTDWAALMDSFLARRGDRQIWGGMHALDITAGYTWDADGLSARVEHARDVELSGTVIFASTYLDQDPSRWDALVGTEEAPGPFFEPARVPALGHR